jgi:REP element-mobilizing transposase RayT
MQLTTVFVFAIIDVNKTPFSMKTTAVPENPQLTELEKIACLTAPPPGGICLRDPGRMHRRLIGAHGECSQFHVMSRTAGGAMLFGDEEKEAFRILMWRMARFSGVEILTYCLMGNHFHLLVRVPKREQFLQRFECDEPGGAGERRLLEHLKLLYSKAYLSRLGREVEELRRQGREAEVQRVFDRYKLRFCELGLFVKEVKERFSRWYNKKNDRRGTLWMDRFRSVIVEDGECLRTVAAYIDLNPVRAGLVERPEDYRWCGYTEALGGSRRMRRGLCRAIGWPVDGWVARGKRKLSGAEAYRCLIYEEGIEKSAGADGGKGKKKARRRISVEEARKVIDAGGKLGHFQAVRCRMRWLSEGVAIGSAGFLMRVLEEGIDVDDLKPLPLSLAGEEADGKSATWFSLSRLRRRGVG